MKDCNDKFVDNEHRNSKKANDSRDKSTTSRASASTRGVEKPKQQRLKRKRAERLKVLSKTKQDFKTISQQRKIQLLGTLR